MKNLFVAAMLLSLTACVPRPDVQKTSTVGPDPNDIAFSIEVPNNYVTNGSPTLSIDVRKGRPAFYCVMVDSTRLPTEPWGRYTSSNLTANLGSTEGWHDIRVGLLGPTPGTRIVWDFKKLNLDRTSPSLTITNPTASLVVQPKIQLQGYSSEDLGHITYDISNSYVLRTNEHVSVSDRFYDSSTHEDTTNYFQASAISLAPGMNTITLRAVDNAGNSTNLVLTYTYDSPHETNPPVVTLRVVVDAQSGNYAAVSGDGRVIALKDTNGIPIWTNDIIAKYGTNLPMYSNGKIGSLEFIEGQIVIYVGKEFICIAPQSGRITRVGSR